MSDSVTTAQEIEVVGRGGHVLYVEEWITGAPPFDGSAFRITKAEWDRTVTPPRRIICAWRVA